MMKADFYFNKERKSLYKEMALMLAGTSLLTFVPFILGKWMDLFQDNTITVIDFSFNATLGYFIFLILLVTLWYLLVTQGRSRYIRNIAMNKTRLALLKKIDRKDVSEIEKQSAGRYVEYISNEQQNVSRLFNSDIVSIVEGLFIFSVIIILMLLTNLTLGLIYIVLLLFTYFAVRRIVKSMKSDLKDRQKSFVKMNSYLDDVSSNYSLIKMYGLEETALTTFKRIDEKLSKYYRHVLYTSGYVSPMERLIENSGFIISGVVGILLLNSNNITAGMFLTFISYASMMGTPLANFADGLGRLKDSSVSMKRINKFLTSPEDERHGDIDAKCSDGNISFEDVTLFSTDGTKILDSVSFDIGLGDHIAVVGASGSGKTSVIDLTVALQSAASGRITYGGKDVFDYEKNSLRRSISVIPSIPWIKTDTIMENLRIAAPDASDEDVISASKFIGLDRSICRMENGYDTLVGMDIDNLSLGERQMVSLVRLLLSDPKVVIFDDSFSGMDGLTAMRIKEKMTDFLQDRTVITISDDIADMVAVDCVLFIGEGRIRQGTHDELMNIPEYVKLLDNVI